MTLTGRRWGGGWLSSQEMPVRILREFLFSRGHSAVRTMCRCTCGFNDAMGWTRGIEPCNRPNCKLRRKSMSCRSYKLLLATFLLGAFTAHAQVIGSYDNFDCFNDTGQTAEGFEIDIQDVSPSDLTREFPS